MEKQIGLSVYDGRTGFDNDADDIKTDKQLLV